MKLYKTESRDNLNYRDYNDNELLSYVSEENEDAIEIIYEKYKPLINKISSDFYRKYCKNTGLDISDLEQEGMIALNNAMNHYKENKDVLFYTYAKTCIERRIISTIVMAHRQKHKILNESVSYEINFDNEQISFDALIKDVKNNPENIIIDMENSKELMKEIEISLTNLEKQVLQLKLDGFEYREIAEILNKESKSIDNALNRIKTKIKKILEKLKKM
jgi:RNA polymerase sporulation-specific sigma factor